MELFQDAEYERTMPQVLQMDQTYGLIGETACIALRAINDDIRKTIIWARIDELDEETLDILAYDLHVDWWKYAKTIESKRENLKNAVAIHRIMGTKAACKMAAEMCGAENVTIQEWFEYAGRPGYFRIKTSANDAIRSLKGLEDLISLIFVVKRLSSWLDEVIVDADLTKYPSTVRFGGAMGTITRTALPELPDKLDFEATLYCGGLVAATTQSRLPELPDKLDFESTVRTGGLVATESRSRVPEITDQVTMSSTGRVGATGSIRTTIRVPGI